MKCDDCNKVNCNACASDHEGVGAHIVYVRG